MILDILCRNACLGSRSRSWVIEPNALDLVTWSQKPGATTRNSHITVYVAHIRRWEYSSSGADMVFVKISRSRVKEGAFVDQSVSSVDSDCCCHTAGKDC